MNPSLSEALAERGYDTLTPVQEAVSDPSLAAADLLVSAQTGSGKTVGFGIAIAPTLLGDNTSFGPADVPLALVVAPTRELAFQVMRELRWLYGKTGARVATCVGGMDMRDERRALDRGAHIVVGTPGRLRDHIARGSLDMTGLRAVVLDEADEMLDLGFREDLEFMLGEAPQDRRTLLFSATVPPMIAKLAQQYQNDAQRINTIGGAKQHADISYQAIRVAHQDQENAIFNLLRFHDADSAIVFANTRAAVNHLMARLSNRGFSVVCLSGELTQSERTNALQAMRDGRASVCVATDVAARGIDLPNLSLVIHADLPSNTESLLHRSGRTGRAGRKGISAMIVPPKSTKKAERLLKWAKITAEWGEAPSADEIRRLDEDRLLQDPAWQEPMSEDESAFAARLVAEQSPEVIAAAYLRLYRERRSAPEELLPADTKPERKERAAFGPSTWFSLSVGRDDGAEPRWLLPMICRAGGIDKSAIGAIRAQNSETFVELSDAAVSGFLDQVGSGLELEDGVRVTQLDGAPNLPDRKPRGPKGAPHRKGGKPPFKRDDRGGSRDDRREDRFEKRALGNSRSPSKSDRPAKSDKPYSKHGDKYKSDAPYKSGKPGEKPRGKFGDKSGDKSGGKSGDKPRGKPSGKYGAKPDFKRDGKPGAKHGDKRDGFKTGKGKPEGKGRPEGDRTKGKRSASSSSDARDSSKRFTPPGYDGPKRKPVKLRRVSGDQPPRRKK